MPHNSLGSTTRSLKVPLKAPLKKTEEPILGSARGRVTRGARCCSLPDKWGFKRWGFKEIRGDRRKKAFFLRFLDFPGALRTLRKSFQRGRKRQKTGEKGRFVGRFPVARHPLNPHLLHSHLRQPKISST